MRKIDVFDPISITRVILIIQKQRIPSHSTKWIRSFVITPDPSIVLVLTPYDLEPNCVDLVAYAPVPNNIPLTSDLEPDPIGCTPINDGYNDDYYDDN